MAYQFLATPYDTNVLIADNGVEVDRKKQVAGPPVVYLTQPLEAGNELVLIVLETKVPTTTHAVGFHFGVTTCPPTRVCRFSSHASGLCSPSSECQGRSAILPVKQCSEGRALITIRRVVEHGQVTVISGKWSGTMSGLNFATVGKVLPYLLLTGDVSAIRIGVQSSRVTRPIQTLTPVPDTLGSVHNGFGFVIPGRPTRGELPKYRSFLRTSMHAVMDRIIFLNSDLRLAPPLVLMVTELYNNKKAEFSFIFGITTCDMSVAGNQVSHRFDPTDASTCGDHSKHCKLPLLKVGDVIVIERLANEFIRFRIGTNVYSLSDDDGFFNEQKIFPFVMMSGNVSAIEIASYASATFGLTPVPDLVPQAEDVRIAQHNHRWYSFVVMDTKTSEHWMAKQANSSVSGIRYRMTFLNRDLRIGEPLYIRVNKLRNEQEFSFVFGVTTCDRTSPDKPFVHDFDYEKPSTCGEHHRHGEIPHQPLGTVVVFQRLADGFVHIKTPTESYYLNDQYSAFRDKKAFPFVMVNGSAYALEILNDDEITPQDLLPQQIHNPVADSITPSEENKPRAESSVSRPSAPRLMAEPSAPFTAVSASSKAGDGHMPHSKPVAVVQSAKPVSGSPVPSRKWYSNPTVSFKDQAMARFGDADKSCCIFGEALKHNESFSFLIAKVNTSFTGSMTFGVTKTPLIQIEMENVPDSSDQDWFIIADMVPVIATQQVHRVTRDENGISVTGDKQRILTVPLDVKVYPFFRFDGAVQQLQMLT